MTPEEIQGTLEQMLAVQRNLQDRQLEQNAQIDSLRTTTEGLVRLSENLLQTSTENREFITRLATVAEQQQESTNQLKRAVDYLMSTDGERG